jgi:hypothetical protein
MADEVQTFKALITIHKVLQEGHPVTVKEAQNHVNWLESLSRGVSGEGLRGESRDAMSAALGMWGEFGARLTGSRIRTAYTGIRILPSRETCLSPTTS